MVGLTPQPPRPWPAALACFLAAGLTGLLPAAETNAPPEVWLTQGRYPQGTDPARLQSNRFGQLQAEFLADTLKVSWRPPAQDAATNVVLRLSVDEPGHWPARDWRSYPMQRRGPAWETILPVDSLDVPLVYFLETAGEEGAGLSPMRLCRPRLLGLEMPTRVFWPFLEGFEEGFESWRWVAGGPDDGQFRTSTPVKNGKAALAVVIPPGLAAVTLGTTRLRGWLVIEHGATGVALWMRTRGGPGQARFAFLAHAFTTNQVVATRPEDVPIRSQWQHLELPFATFSKVPLSDLDFFTLELIGKPGTEFLIDDLQLLGPWQLN
jgi:hypothetical protein